jgi:hypothetical protein
VKLASAGLSRGSRRSSTICVWRAFAPSKKSIPLGIIDQNVCSTPMLKDGSRADVRYDVCLSFAGENRGVVHSVAKRLATEGIRVFYDEYEKANLWGKDLYAHLDEVYSSAARYCGLKNWAFRQRSYYQWWLEPVSLRTALYARGKRLQSFGRTCRCKLDPSTDNLPGWTDPSLKMDLEPQKTHYFWGVTWTVQSPKQVWRPQRDSNPRYRRERAMS